MNRARTELARLWRELTLPIADALYLADGTAYEATARVGGLVLGPCFDLLAADPDWMTHVDISREHALPDGTLPDGPLPGDSQLNGTLPDGTLPDGTLPDGTLPDGTLPDGSQFDGALPGGSQFDGVLPGGAQLNRFQAAGSSTGGSLFVGDGAHGSEGVFGRITAEREPVWIVCLADCNPFTEINLDGRMATFASSSGVAVTVDIDHPDRAS
ncbi:hypothetical protein [Amycolatopsis sp. YIM 10]|uniref:hypothetical protein n=1 Tax=Amycolatopsis sp. YIM 10 TaxID=2653857 RepID=UPI0012908833|nr:hypothetical protein [Amycolatopsis sp. YIM 10]QFU93903.1 hypothetical protein YIM_43845 [Amycolatopsis sp. YIM 10]